MFHVPCSVAALVKPYTYGSKPNLRFRNHWRVTTKFWSSRFLNRRFAAVLCYMGQMSRLKDILTIERAVENQKPIWIEDFGNRRSRSTKIAIDFFLDTIFVYESFQSSRVVCVKSRGYHHESSEPPRTKNRNTKYKNSRALATLRTGTELCSTVRESHGHCYYLPSSYIRLKLYRQDIQKCIALAIIVLQK